MFTFFIVLYNFAIVGVLSIFYQKVVNVRSIGINFV